MFYNPIIQEHFENPLNSGSLDNPSVSVTVGNPKEGAVIKLDLNIVENKIQDLKFKAYGAIAIASMSYMTEQIKGLTVIKTKFKSIQNLKR